MYIRIPIKGLNIGKIITYFLKNIFFDNYHNFVIFNKLNTYKIVFIH